MFNRKIIIFMFFERRVCKNIKKKGSDIQYQSFLNVGKSATFENLAASETVVVQWCQPLLGIGRHFFTDNYYSSISFSKYLRKKESYYCGTLSANRKRTPKQVTQAKLKTGDVISRQSSDGVKIYNWKD